MKRAASTFVRSRPSHVLVLMLACLGSGHAAAAREGAPVDAGSDTPADAGSVTVTSAAQDAGEAALAPELARLTDEIAALRALVDGTTPSAGALQPRFAVDLGDEGAVAARVAVLRRQLAATPIGIGIDGGVDGGVDGGLDGGVAVDGAEGDTGSALRRERDRLLLAFLERPAAERAQLLEGSRRRRQLLVEQDEARAARASAEAAGKQASLARDAALDTVRQAGTEAARGLASERARLEDARQALAGLRARLAVAREDEVRAERRREAAVESLLQRIRARGADADGLYDEVLAALAEQRESLRTALDALSEPSPVERFAPSLDLGADSLAAFPDEVRALQAARAMHTEEMAALEEEIARRRRVTAAARAADVARLSTARTELLDALSPGRRDRMQGFTREGLDQLLREVEHVRLMARWYLLLRRGDLQRLPAALDDGLAVGIASLRLAQATVLIGALVFVRRRLPRWLTAIRASVLRRAKSPSLRLWAVRWVSAVGAVAGQLAFLLGVYALFDGVAADLRIPELALVRDLVVAFAWYRLLLALAHRSLTAAAHSGQVGVTRATSDRIYTSVRLVGRFGLAIAAFLIVSSAILGKGALYRIAVDFAFVGAIPIAVILLGRWRADITHAYLRMFPNGSLAAAVERTRDRPIGFFIAVLAFLTVAVRGIAAWAQRTALEFEQTRKALAYLFRRRLERAQETAVQHHVEVAALPPALRDAFSEGDVVDAAWRVDRFPELSEVAERATRCLEGKGGFALALTGDPGSGRSSWLNELAERLAGQQVARCSVDKRITTERDVAALCGAVLGAPAARSAADIIDFARNLEPRIVLLDDCQNLVLRAPGGMEGYRAFVDLVARTRESVCWIASFSGRSYAFSQKVCGGRNAFDLTVPLAPWTEADIAELVSRRMKAAGYEAEFDDLVIDHVDGTAFESEVIRTGESFRRLLWDYADGNPRVACHFWLRSLAPTGTRRMRVRLFAAPSADGLEDLEEITRFVLATLVQHHAVTAEEVARVLRYPESSCEAALAFLRARGVVTARGAQHEVASHWDRAVIRFLRRKNLLFS